MVGAHDGDGSTGPPADCAVGNAESLHTPGPVVTVVTVATVVPSDVWRVQQAAVAVPSRPVFARRLLSTAHTALVPAAALCVLSIGGRAA